MPVRTVLLLAAALASAGCGRSRWADLRVSAVASVDGKPVRASTIWRTQVVDEPLSQAGGRSKLRGTALAIPVSSGHYVYGLIAMITGTMVTHGTFLDSVPQWVLASRNRRSGLGDWPTAPSKRSDYVVAHMLGHDITVCQQRPSAATSDACPVFVYFEDPSDLQTVRMVRPYEPVDIAGHMVVIEKVSVSFVPTGSTSGSTEADLPPGIRQEVQSQIGKLPPGLKPESSRILSRRDFIGNY